MIPVISESPSMILRSSHILRVRLDAAQMGEWSHHPSGWQERRADLTLTLLEVFKGKVDETSGAQFRLQMIQLSSGPFTLVPAPGIWSDKSLESGVVLVAFSRGQDGPAADLLKEPVCEKLVLDDQAVADVHLAQQAETEKLPLDEVVNRAVGAAGSLHDIFMEYLWARWEDTALQNPEDFEKVMDLFETPGLGYLARATLLHLVLGDVLSGRAIPEITNRLAVAFFRLLNLGEAVALHDNILQTYLPSLLGLGTSNERAVRDVFRDFPGDLNRVETLRGLQSAAPLLDWLHR
jgi:hypothetical protein